MCRTNASLLGPVEKSGKIDGGRVVGLFLTPVIAAANDTRLPGREEKLVSWRDR